MSPRPSPFVAWDNVLWIKGMPWPSTYKPNWVLSSIISRRREGVCSPSRRATPSLASSTSRSKNRQGLPVAALSDQSPTELSVGAEPCNMSRAGQFRWVSPIRERSSLWGRWLPKPSSHDHHDCTALELLLKSLDHQILIVDHPIWSDSSDFAAFLTRSTTSSPRSRTGMDSHGRRLVCHRYACGFLLEQVNLPFPD
ncbi:hypothetical protein DVH24_009549 [Malus domestica]|uniref:Uncharacterized protein n=1 Tax=Malus domestica TaxID=3750 RepID=A0A498IQH5_MALDO|nr:hypothetical protein DVH24_009549 [Malus domestica]